MTGGWHTCSPKFICTLLLQINDLVDICMTWISSMGLYLDSSTFRVSVNWMQSAKNMSMFQLLWNGSHDIQIMFLLVLTFLRSAPRNVSKMSHFIRVNFFLIALNVSAFGRCIVFWAKLLFQEISCKNRDTISKQKIFFSSIGFCSYKFSYL